MKRQFLSSAFALFQDSIKGLKSSPLLSADKRKPTTNALRKSLFVAMLGAGSLSMAGTASATLIESIDALDEGALYRVLFVTSTQRDASSSEIGDYNTFVGAAAATGSITSSLGLTWTALASTATVNAQLNTGIFNNDNNNVTMFNTFGEVIATSGAELWGGILTNNLNGDESGVQRNVEVWTGTSGSGSTNTYSTLGMSDSHYGYSGNLNSQWMYSYDSWFYNPGRFYAASSIASKPITAAPEPGTVILLSLGLAGLSFARYRRQS